MAIGLHLPEYNGKRMGRLILTRLRTAAAAAALLLIAGCTPQSALLMGLLPDGTVSKLLNHLEGHDDEYKKRVLEMEAKKDWAGIARLADQNVARDRNNADWQFVAGYAHAQAGRPGRAAEAFGELTRLRPNEPEGWNLLAQASRDNKQPQRAVQALNTAHQLQKGSAASYFLLGESYADMDRDLPAADAYRQAVQIDADFAPAWFGFGRASARLGRREDFERSMKSLERLDPPRARELAELRPASLKR